GETLRTRLAREHQLPIADVVRIASEVASALDYAHRQGVVHRDIKPENILLHDGQALVADFGIALAVQTAGGERMTQTGLSLGTPSYMSPEQAMGEKTIDARSDVYALGAVTYEMLTGDAPFTGSTVQAIVAKVLSADAERPTMLRKTVPPHVEATVLTALAKLPADRFATAAEFKDAINRPDYAGASTQASSVVSRQTATTRTVKQRVLHATPWALAVAGLATSAWLATHQAALPPPPVSRFAVRFTPEVVTGRPAQTIAMSQDGSRIAYVGAVSTGIQLFMRTMSDVVPTPIPGTINAMSPFFSPDGEQLGFVMGTKLFKVAVAGGPALPVTDVGTTFRGGTWSATDTILFADERGLLLVPAAGGQASLLVRADSATGEVFTWPEFLPGDKAALVSINDGNADRLAAVTIPTAKLTRFDVLGGNPHYVDHGYVTLGMIEAGSGGVVSGTLMAVPFDAKRLRVLGQRIPVTDSVQVGLNSRAAKLGISRRGTLAFASGTVGMSSIVAVTRTGVVRELSAQPKFYSSPRLSPDGKRIAVVVNDVGTDIWVHDMSSRTLSRLTFDRSGQRPAWTPDGRRVVYERRGSESTDLAWIAADGSSQAESLTVAPQDQIAESFTPDGRTLLIGETLLGGRRSIAVVAVDSARKPRPLLATTTQNFSPSLSPDGRWMAYVSDETGRLEVYVRPFPGPGGRWQISKDGGNEPRWSPTGREIFFRSGPAMMAAEVQAGAQFASGAVRELFRTTASTSTFHTNYDVTRDGQTFIMVQPKASNDQNV
ncbi:MAG: PD40 domain-containing protein, partial [Gemmatimonadetes bacterium]|nr:PD40 domain-containing protein [Gemmatimonadota bacterium]